MAYLTTTDGDFWICSEDHEGVIAMDALASGTPTRLWRQASATDCVYNTGDVNAVAATADAVYVGGHVSLFSDGTQYRSHLAALDPATGTPLAFNPNVGGTAGVLSLNVTPAGLLVGGDFDTASGGPNSRFALFRRGPDGVGPPKPAAPRVTSANAGQLLVRWSTVTDGTDNQLVYSVYRDNAATPVYQVTGVAVSGRSLSWTDTSQAVGTSHVYKIRAADGSTNQTGNNAAAVAVSATDHPVPYAATVLADQPSFFWRLGETNSSQPAADASPNGRTGVYSAASAQLARRRSPRRRPVRRRCTPPASTPPTAPDRPSARRPRSPARRRSRSRRGSARSRRTAARSSGSATTSSARAPTTTGTST